MSNTIKVAKLPGTVTEVVAEQGASFRDVIALAGQDSQGFEVKADGRTITNLDESADGVSMILLAKQVKGNQQTVKVAKLPGAVKEIAVEEGTTFREAIQLAEMDSQGFEVKADGRTITNLDEAIGQVSMILLAKQVKGNA
jgi:cellobiose-specific phosphotransferase system component IIB